MRSSPKYRFFRVMIGGELVDVDIFQYSHKTTVVMSMLYYNQEQIIMASVTAPERKIAIKGAALLFQETQSDFLKRQILL